MDREAWWATVDGVTKGSDMIQRLNNRITPKSSGNVLYKAESSACCSVVTYMKLSSSLNPSGKESSHWHTKDTLLTQEISRVLRTCADRSDSGERPTPNGQTQAWLVPAGPLEKTLHSQELRRQVQNSQPPTKAWCS